MTQERIQFFENLLKKPMAEPHRGYIEELFAEVKGKASGAKWESSSGTTVDLRAKPQAKPKGYQVPIAPLIESPE